MFHIVLHEPEIPFNTGAIARTCVATGSSLHMIRPYGFVINDKMIRRAGMDYWPKVDLHEYVDFEDFLAQNAGLVPSGISDSETNRQDVSLASVVHERMNAQQPADCRWGETGGAADCPPQEDGGRLDYLRGEACDPSGRLKDHPRPHLWFATTKAHQLYSDVSFGPEDYIMFGKESAGIPEEILVDHEADCIRIPMWGDIRSLNLSNSVAIILYEALRQNHFLNLTASGTLHHLKWKS